MPTSTIINTILVLLHSLSEMLIVIDDNNAIFAYKMAHAIHNKKSLPVQAFRIASKQFAFEQYLLLLL